MYLTYILIQSKVQNSQLSTLLIKYLIQDLIEYSSKKNSSKQQSSGEDPTSTKFLQELKPSCTFLQHSFIAHRDPWLDQLNEIKTSEKIESTTDQIFTALVNGFGSEQYLKYILYSAQGLLCSDKIIDTKEVLQMIEQAEEFFGKFSLNILCLTKLRMLEKAYDLMLNEKMEVIFSYAIQNFKNINDWKILTDKLSLKIQSESDKHKMVRYIHLQC